MDRTITICVNAYRKRTVPTVLTNMWHQIRQYILDSTTETPEYRPEPYGPNSTTTPPNTGRHFDTPLRLVTSRPRHLASPNISTIVHEMSKFRYIWREWWCNCVWKTLPHLYSLLVSVEIHLRPFPHHGLSHDHVVRHPRITGRSTSNLFDTPGFYIMIAHNHIVMTNAQNNYILFEFCLSITKNPFLTLQILVIIYP